jgi:hypothetical protein
MPARSSKTFAAWALVYHVYYIVILEDDVSQKSTGF